MLGFGDSVRSAITSRHTVRYEVTGLHRRCRNTARLRREVTTSLPWRHLSHLGSPPPAADVVFVAHTGLESSTRRAPSGADCHYGRAYGRTGGAYPHAVSRRATMLAAGGCSPNGPASTAGSPTMPQRTPRTHEARRHQHGGTADNGNRNPHAVPHLADDPPTVVSSCPRRRGRPAKPLPRGPWRIRTVRCGPWRSTGGTRTR